MVDLPASEFEKIRSQEFEVLERHFGSELSEAIGFVVPKAA